MIKNTIYIALIFTLFSQLNAQTDYKISHLAIEDGLFDFDWNYSGNRRFAAFSNLPPGEYSFKVKGSNNAKIWNEKGAAINVIVFFAFWQTWWFRIFIALLLIAILLFYYRVRTKSIIDRNVKLESALEMKTKEMKILMEKMVTQEKLATVGQVTGSIAHELRNPLGTIKQSIFYLKSKINDPGKINKHLNLIDSELAVASQVIDDLLEITQLQKTNKKYTDIELLIKEAVEKCALIDDVKVEIEIESEAKFLWVDPVQLRQVFVNLVTNSIQSIEGKGFIKIHGHKQLERFIQLDVSDNGAGIKNEDIQKIFEPLFTTKVKGTGLGLSVCREIITKHDGKISVISKINEGTIVSILLPIEKDQKI